MAFVDLFEQAAAGDRVCLCGMLAAELSALDDRNRALLARFFELVEAWLVGRLKRSRDALGLKLPPAKLAAVILSGLEGALLLDRVHRAGQHLDAQRQWIAGVVAGR
jgi:TetR/AcrR family transcriptional repressor of nem operon